MFSYQESRGLNFLILSRMKNIIKPAKINVSFHINDKPTPLSIIPFMMK